MVRVDGAVGLLTKGFLVVFNRKLCPNSVPLSHIRLQNRSDLYFDL